MLPDLQLNDHLRLRKQHPCGSYEWTVTRLGADIGLECKGCGRRVMLTRRELADFVRGKGAPAQAAATLTALDSALDRSHLMPAAGRAPAVMAPTGKATYNSGLEQ